MPPVDQMMRTKDEYTRAFEHIMNKTGKTDMDKIVHDFIEAEEENFSIFQNIGEHWGTSILLVKI